jgi:hypothetical protein
MSHPLHLTVTNIDIENGTINIAVRIFIDDFTTAVIKSNNLNASFNPLADDLQTNNEIIKYINANFKVLIKGEPLLLKYLKKKKEELAVWIYFSGKCSSLADNFTIENSLLCNLYGDQHNMVIIDRNSIEKGLEFSLSDTKKNRYF